MKKHTRSILEELSEISRNYDKTQMIENKAVNAIASVSNLLNLIHETYSEDVAKDLEKRLINSLRTQDEKKFIRGIRKINESKDTDF